MNADIRVDAYPGSAAFEALPGLLRAVLQESAALNRVSDWCMALHVV